MPRHGPAFRPDFEITSPIHYWLEAVTAERGTGNDAIPETPLGVVCSVPDDEAKLRILTAIRAKEIKRRTYLKDGIVGPGDCYVIAINLAKAPLCSMTNRHGSCAQCSVERLREFGAAIEIR